jgi:hypothetical protein
MKKLTVKERMTPQMSTEIERLNPNSLRNLTGLTDVSKNAKVRDKWLDYVEGSPKSYSSWMDSWEDFLIRHAIPFEETGRIKNPDAGYNRIMRESKTPAKLKDLLALRESNGGVMNGTQWVRALERISNLSLPDIWFSCPFFNVMMTNHGEIGLTTEKKYSWRIYFVFQGSGTGTHASEYFVYESPTHHASHEHAKKALEIFVKTLKIKK